MPWFLMNLWVLVWIATRWDIPGLVEFVIAFGFYVLLIQMWGILERRRSSIQRTTSVWFVLWIVVTSVGVVASITDDHVHRTEEVSFSWGTEAYLNTKSSILGVVYDQQSYLVRRQFAEPVVEWSTTVEERSRTWEVQIPTGAICRDGWQSSSTGSGTCSWHGGVSVWTYRTETGTTTDEVEVAVSITIPPPPPPPGVHECSNVSACAED